MMYVDFNKDGSIKTLIIGESIQQGSNNVNTLFATIDGYNTSDYRCVAQFTLPDQSVQQVLGEVATEDINEVPHTGYLVTITENETYLAGTVKVNLKLIQNLGDEVLATYQVFLKINPTGYEPNVEFITEYQYNQLIAALGSFATNERVEKIENQLTKKVNTIRIDYKWTKIENGKVYYSYDGVNETATTPSHFYVWNSELEKWEDKAEELALHDYDGISLINGNFNSQNARIPTFSSYVTPTYIIEGEIGSGTPTLWLWTVHAFNGKTSLNTGDIILVEENDVPDRWFSYTYFHNLETGEEKTKLYYKVVAFSPTGGGTTRNLKYLSTNPNEIETIDELIVDYLQLNSSTKDTVRFDQAGGEQSIQDSYMYINSAATPKYIQITDKKYVLGGTTYTESTNYFDDENAHITNCTITSL